MAKVKLQIEIQKILSVISKDIYDSPYALLRENVQNAYDAILMRQQKDSSFEPLINVEISNTEIVIKDNGIGMDQITIENNYWKAGSSGKNNDEARLAGVVGTFGIGAMANFGICSQLEVRSKAYNTNTTYASKAVKETLSVSDDCISLELSDIDLEDYGTEVRAVLDSNVHLNENDSISYLLPYVQYLKFPVILNGKIISQKSYIKDTIFDNINNSDTEIKNSEFSFSLNIKTSNAQGGGVSIYANNFMIREEPIKGDIFLEQEEAAIFGLRNNFGLAPIPLNSNFNLGGIVNLSFLIPTAGREALNRESIDYVSRIVTLIEQNIAEEIAKYDIADSNKYFLSYIQQKNRYNLANKIKIQCKPDDERISLESIQQKMNGKDVYYYSGNDAQIIAQYANENSYLLLLSRDNPRRTIQQRLLASKQIEPILDNPKILKKFPISDLTTAESALIFRLSSTLKEDYLLQDTKVYFAEISHNVPNMIIQKGSVVYIYLSRNSGNIQQVLKIYNGDFRLFDGFVKDYIRNYLYQKIAPYVPSSTKQGADALFKILQKNKELYTIDYDEFGDVENLMKEYIAGNISINEVFKASEKTRSIQTQTVSPRQIGTIEIEIPNVTHAVENNDEDIRHDNLLPSPPILIEGNETQCKIIKTEEMYAQLNNFNFFLGLSDKLFDRERDFFFEPHSTKIIWGMHKIVYIFTHASNNISLYYDIELKDKLDDSITGGLAIPTTTIITKNRLFVPIVPQMIPYFNIKHGSKKFYVRYDLIMQFEDTK